MFRFNNFYFLALISFFVADAVAGRDKGTQDLIGVRGNIQISKYERPTLNLDGSYLPGKVNFITQSDGFSVGQGIVNFETRHERALVGKQEESEGEINALENFNPFIIEIDIPIKFTKPLPKAPHISLIIPEIKLPIPDIGFIGNRPESYFFNPTSKGFMLRMRLGGNSIDANAFTTANYLFERLIEKGIENGIGVGFVAICD